MQYHDNQRKFVAILNKRHSLPRLLNALGHATAGLVSLHQDDESTTLDFLCYEDADGNTHPAISRYPFIVLSAKNSNQLRTLRREAHAVGLRTTDFVEQMLGASAADQLRATKSAKEADLEYIALCLFGPGVSV